MYKLLINRAECHTYLVVNMIATHTLLCLLLLALSQTNAIPRFIHPGKEYIYNYHGRVNTGTYKPTLYASQFIMDAKLHFQNHGNTLTMKLSNVSFKLNNGKFIDYDSRDSIALNLPKDAEDLLKPVQIGYTDDGLIKYFAADKDDRKFSRNVKKSIASLFQMDLNKVNFDAEVIEAFYSHEDSTYGNVKVRYFCSPEGPEFIVQKMLDVKSSDNWLGYFGITDDTRYEDLSSREFLSLDAHRDFTMLRTDHGLNIQEIFTNGGIYAELMKSSSESLFMTTNRTVELIEIVPITEELPINEERIKEDLSFKLEISEDDETIVDLSFGRNEIPKEEYETLVYGILDEIVNHTQINHLKMETPDIKQGQSINRLVRIMIKLDLTSLEKLFLNLEEQPNQDKFKIFQELIPLIGTRASVKFLRNLIRKHKIPEDVAIEMLKKMPFHLRMPSEKLLTEVEDLMSLENVTPELHKTGVLTFATLINKVYSHHLIRKKLLKHTPMKEDLLEKYIIKYMDLLKASQDYASQYLYMSGLYNIKIGSVIKHLEPYVTGKATTNHHLRYLAMCASFSEAIKNEKRVYEVYTPLLTEFLTLPIELRIAAYVTIMATKPSKEKLLDLYWTIKHANEIYDLHYSYLQSIANSQEVTLQEYREVAKEMLNIMRVPYRPSPTGVYMADYIDPKFGFSAMNRLMLISTNVTKSFYFDFGTTIYNFPVMNKAYWFKITGVDMSLVKYKENVNTLEQFIEMIKQLSVHKNLHIEYAVLQKDKNVEIGYIDHNSIDLFVMKLIHLSPINSFDISYLLSCETILPNDLGLPAMFTINIPSLTNSNIENAQLETRNHWQYQQSQYSKYGLSFYNSIADVWQGINRYQCNEIITDLSFDISISKASKLEINIYNQSDETRDKFAMRNYATTMTFVYKDVNNLLQQSSKNSQHFQRVSEGNLFENSRTFFDHHNEYTGLHLQVSQYDTNRHTSPITIMKQFQNLFQNYFKNYETMPMGYMLLVLQTSAHYLQISPEIGTNGFIITAKPSQKYNIDKIKFNLDFHSKGNLKNTFVQTKYTTKDKDDKVLKRLDSSADLEFDNELSLIKYFIQLTSFNLNETQKMCLEGDKNRFNKNFISTLNISLGNVDIDKYENCADNLGLIEIEMRDEKSVVQIKMEENNVPYNECIMKHYRESKLRGIKVNYKNNFECIKQKTSLGNKAIEIMSYNVSEQLMRYFPSKNIIKNLLSWPYFTEYRSERDLGNKTAQMILNYYPSNNEIEAHIFTGSSRYSLNLPSYFSAPNNYYFSYLFEKLYDLNMIESCLITDLHIYNSKKHAIKIIDDEWTNIAYTNTNVYKRNNFVVLVKQIGEKIALKIKMDDQILQISPIDDNYKFKLNDKEFTVGEDSYEDKKWFRIGLMNKQEKIILLNMLNIPLYITYDGDRLEMFKILTDFSVIGTCFAY